MPKENSDTTQLVQSIEAARDALDAALKILKKEGVHPKRNRPAKATKLASTSPSALDFTMPLRAFVKKYSLGLNGAKKFTLLIAYLTRRQQQNGVPIGDRISLE